MGRYLDRLRAKNSTDSYGNEVSKVSKAPFEPFETTLPQENRKNLGGGITVEAGAKFCTHAQNGTVKSVKSRWRVSLAEYSAMLDEGISSTDPLPIPPYKLGDLEHAAAWSARWDAVELQRAHRSKVTAQ